MWLFRRAETDGAYHMAESGLALTACSTPMRLRPADVPATYPCSSARIRKPGIGMITREALNAGENAEGKSTPLCHCWMQSCPPCLRPAERASKPHGRKSACPPMPCNTSCPCRASLAAGGNSRKRRAHLRPRTNPRINPLPVSANPCRTQPPRLRLLLHQELYDVALSN